MMAFAVLGIKNSGLNLAVELLALFLVIIWLALVYWTFADARRRVADPMLVGVATAAALFPFVGTIVYAIVRPPEYLDDVRERDLEMQAAEVRLAQSGYHLCPYCERPVEKDFLSCPSCLHKLKDPCRVCGRPLEADWKICPFCETEVGAAGAQRRVRRRREGVADQASQFVDGQASSPRQAQVRSPVSRQSAPRQSGESPPTAPGYGRPQTTRP
ncbi:MAG: zinc ribbon domain-containing protein [Solirubrobacterales bacterium]|nr:zinc ribbon domain-containing protein [Solirubrobacterales bacterium]